MASKKVQDNTPKSIKAGPLTYEVRWDADKMYEHDFNGETSYRGRIIRLNPVMPDSQVPLTFMHEILHAIGDAANINYWEYHKYENEKIIDQIDLMARSLLLFMRANPKIVNWLVIDE